VEDGIPAGQKMLFQVRPERRWNARGSGSAEAARRRNPAKSGNRQGSQSCEGKSKADADQPNCFFQADIKLILRLATARLTRSSRNSVFKAFFKAKSHFKVRH